jgi:hypothetical protein
MATRPITGAVVAQGPPDPRRIAAELPPTPRKAILRFGGVGWAVDPPGSGWWREWCDILERLPPRVSHRSAIDPLIRRGLAERANKPNMHCFRRLTSLGVAVQQIVMEEDNDMA